MTNFDVRTAILIVGLLYLLLPSITWLVLARQRTLQVALWCGGGLMVGIGMILIGLSGSTSDWITFGLTNTLILLSHFARIQSLRLDLGIPWRTLSIVLAIVAISLVKLGIALGVQNAPARAQFSSLVGAVCTIYIAMLAWRIGRNEKSPSAKWIAIVYALVGLAFIVRLDSLLTNNSDGDVLTDGYSSVFLTLTLLLSSVVGHFGYVGLALDRSSRRELQAATDQARNDERHHLSATIAQLDRQRSMGQMSASLGHELNQPLTAILTNAQVAKRSLQAGLIDASKHMELLDKVIHSTQRASQIIERIRGYIRPSATQNIPVSLNLIVQEVMALVADDAKIHGVTIKLPPSKTPVWVTADPIQLSQIVLNVFRNAIEALVQSTRREILVTCDTGNGRTVLRIRDTGAGLTPEAMTQAGTPFFTTKPTGLGLGLSISRTIAEQHGGTLTLYNAPIENGGGTIVEIDLPSMPAVNS